MSEISECLYMLHVNHYHDLYPQHDGNILLRNTENALFDNNGDKTQKESPVTHGKKFLTICYALEVVRHSDLQLDTDGTERHGSFLKICVLV
jgi:hypothetical protein